MSTPSAAPICIDQISERRFVSKSRSLRMSARRPSPPAGRGRYAPMRPRRDDSGGRPPVFRDRREAGRLLGARLAEEAFTNPHVLALPRGGVPVGYEVALALPAPLDVFVARKV